ncbi:putative ABC transport system permease protein [Dyadobacter sp. BE34]|uniref:ABC transport system permease protein n=1 Tax=Dyadobacter fermentans TaxID=94254 RepID=A0ABU1R4L7_9BACT|nr:MULTISPECIES: permease prefix domain 2-containing transporter [Dyadobacter]MDR6808321.1 putative ABC transport system permease protein [Dyadobacter fermentans]MDR7045863.1 putative ABC transport system permease protein [Dyadobacter sp. BE242]MDR7200176.1 putative ABC transport system permease protein [Dyadobacter sp. BE34]MDR7218136.1 putative ABC transport system permease protein [Dyadobacter sp. BE31]MDR7266067.1 putative ABC transport system permease protein [Dyadobacter sp. BE32]
MQPLPPRWLDKLATRICAPHLREELLGDLHERYALRHRRTGARKANFFFLREVSALLRPSIMRRQPSRYGSPSAFSRDMLRNYFKIGSRVLVKNSGYSLIHLTGLSIGLWACMMVATVVIDSLSYDRQWSRKDDIYRIVTVNKMGEGLFERNSSSVMGLAPELQKNYTAVESWANISSGEKYFKIRPEDSDGINTSLLTADTSISKILDIKLLGGSLKRSTQKHWSLLVTQSYAARLFPGQNPIGKIIYDIPIFSSEPTPYEITGLIDDLPYNSHLRADAIRLEVTKPEPLVATGIMSFGRNYILLKRGTDVGKFTKKVNAWYADFTKNKGREQFEFQPFKDIYLHSDFAEGQSVKASIRTIYIFAGVALLVLFIACVNFVNLSTAKAFARVKEAGVRKVLSGSRTQLVMQLLTETLLLFGISVGIAVFAYFFTLRPVENFLGHRLVLTFTSNILMAGGALLMFFFTALLTGLYPAWIISGFKPANTLRGIFTASLGQTGLRKTLVVAQFSISIIVLLATIVVWQQFDLMKNKDLGYDKNNLIGIEQIAWNGKGEAFKNELQRIPGVVRSSLSMWMPTEGAGYMQREVPDPAHAGRRLRIWYVAGDVDLPTTLGLKLVKGRMFSNRFADAFNADSLREKDFVKFEKMQMNQNSLMTASAAKMLRIKQLDVHAKDTQSVPVGVVGDFHNESLYEPLKPTLILAQKAPEYAGMLIRIEPGTEMQVGAGVRKLWKQFFPEKLLRIHNIEEKLEKQYEAESKLHQLFLFFSGLTMFLSALGIFGLVVQAAEQRAKEVGIRKVLGASVAGIVGLISKDFVKLVVIAIVVASPLAWYALQKWLESYPYRTTIHWWVFAVTGAAALAVTIGTVSFQAIRAATADPVRSLRNE